MQTPSQETLVYYVIGIGAALLIIILVAFMYSIQRYHRLKMLSFEDKLMSEVAVLEQERQRIAQDLHDELGGILSSVKYHLQCIDLEGPQELPLRKAEKYIDSSLVHMRSICRNLLPPSLESGDLVTVLGTFVDNWNRDKPLPLQFRCDDTSISLDNRVTLHLYRVIQEILNNALKHARATTAVLSCVRTNKQLQLTIQDNGVGFDQQQAVADPSGLGLRNIAARVELIKGELFLDTAPGKGTTYILNLPYTL